MKVTTFFLPEDAEDLLDATHRSALCDLRVEDVASRLTACDARDDESGCERNARAWRFLLPDQDANDVLIFRTTFGWTEGEMAQIVGLLKAVQQELLGMSNDPLMLSGTRTALIRDAERVEDLLSRWTF